MARRSFSRTVARAAASGGSKGYRARAPRGWYAMLSVILLGGFALIGYSRYELNYKAPALAPTTADHWYSALSFDVCGTVEPNIPANANASTIGIRTFGNGIIDIEPSAASKPSIFTGKHATLGTFVANYSGLVLSSTVLGLPNPNYKPSATTTTLATTTTSKSTTTKAGATTTTKVGVTTTTKAGTTTTLATTPTSKSTTTKTKSATKSTTTTTAAPITKPLVSNGESCTPSLGPDKGVGHVMLEVWPSPTAKGKIYKGNPSNLRLKNGQMITVGFVPQSVKSLPEPASKSIMITDLGGLTNSGTAAQAKLKKALESTTTSKAVKSTSKAKTSGSKAKVSKK